MRCNTASCVSQSSSVPGRLSHATRNDDNATAAANDGSASVWLWPVHSTTSTTNHVPGSDSTSYLLDHSVIVMNGGVLVASLVIKKRVEKSEHKTKPEYAKKDDISPQKIITAMIHS